MRDFAEVKRDGTVSADIAAQALDMLNVDAEGFDYIDRVLLAVIDKFFGGRHLDCSLAGGRWRRT
ncbi:hypothetical protein ACNKHU_10995 [Shigella flexneri]